MDEKRRGIFAHAVAVRFNGCTLLAGSIVPKHDRAGEGSQHGLTVWGESERSDWHGIGLEEHAFHISSGIPKKNFRRCHCELLRRWSEAERSDAVARNPFVLANDGAEFGYHFGCVQTAPVCKMTPFEGSQVLTSGRRNMVLEQSLGDVELTLLNCLLSL